MTNTVELDRIADFFKATELSPATVKAQPEDRVRSLAFHDGEPLCEILRFDSMGDGALVLKARGNEVWRGPDGVALAHFISDLALERRA